MSDYDPTALVTAFGVSLPHRKIVDRIDSDGDGFVTTEELKVWIKRVQKRYIYDNVAKVWKDYDRDTDGKISWEEYKQATYGYYLGERRCGVSPNRLLVPWETSPPSKREGGLEEGIPHQSCDCATASGGSGSLQSPRAE